MVGFKSIGGPRFSTLSGKVDSGRPLLLSPSGISEAIKDALSVIPPTTTIAPSMSINGTTKSYPTAMGQATKNRPHHQFLAYFYPLPQLPPPLWIPSWPPPPSIHGTNRTNRPSGHYLRRCRYNANYGLQTAPLKMPSQPWGEKGHEGLAQNQKRKKITMQREEEMSHGVPSGRKIRWFKVRGPAPQSPAAHLLTPEQKETTMSPGRPPACKIKRFKVREPPQRSSPYIHHEQGRPPGTSNHPKFLWRIGKLSKPEYIEHCNNLHVLHQEYP